MPAPNYDIPFAIYVKPGIEHESLTEELRKLTKPGEWIDVDNDYTPVKDENVLYASTSAEVLNHVFRAKVIRALGQLVPLEEAKVPPQLEHLVSRISIKDGTKAFWPKQLQK